jgi:hypothetical protein
MKNQRPFYVELVFQSTREFFKVKSTHFCIRICSDRLVLVVYRNKRKIETRSDIHREETSMKELRLWLISTSQPNQYFLGSTSASRE